MNLSMMSNPLTPVFHGVQMLASKWPAITTFAVVNYGGAIVMDMTPSEDTISGKLITEGVRGAFDIVKLSTWDAIKGSP